jgi:hypothetical protein
MTGGPFMSPFDDSRAPSRAGSEDDLNTPTVSEKFNIMPSAGLLLFPEDVEKDDYLHNPDPNDKEERDCNIFTKRGFANVGGLALFAIGLLVLFIGYPILTFVDKITAPEKGPCTNNPLCIQGKQNEPLLKNLRTGLIDPDTPKEAMSRTSADGSKQILVFSDEFNTAGRSFYEGDDPFFTAVDIWYGATQDLEVSLIRFLCKRAVLTPHSGMIQTWFSPRTARSTSGSNPERPMGSTSAQAWSSRGTSCATRADI